MSSATAEIVAAPGIRYIDGFRLHRALAVGIKRVISRQEHLNRINVFPVPDGDTGTNIALTLSAVLAGISSQMDRHVGNMLNALADAALDGARGNSGAILAQFFQGMSDGAGALPALSTRRFVKAVRLGAEYAREALAEPKEGTLLTVLTDFSTALDRRLQDGHPHDIAELLREGLVDAERSLANTTNQLEVLRKAGVVDAGAAGFVELLRGMVELIESGSLREMQGFRPDEELDIEQAAVEAHGGGDDLTHRYCTECLITGTDIDRRKLREELSGIGSSLVIAGTKEKVKVHVHVNNPGQAFLIAESYGTLSSQKADDMQAQSTTAAHARGIAVITDSGADIPDQELERLNIHIVPLRLHFGDRGYLDKVSITPREFYDELARNTDPPKTSQPAPGDFRRQFQFLASHHEAVLSVNLMRKASGTCQAAESAAARVEGAPTTVLDSMNVSAGQALLVMHAAELAQAGMPLEDIIRSVERMRTKTKVWGAIADLGHAVRGGRVSRGKKLATDLLRLRPVLTNTPDGNIGVGGVLVGKSRMVEKFARFVLRRLDPARPWRLIIGHADAREQGVRLREALVARLPQVQASWLVELGPALGVHAGPGALVVGAQEYDPAL
jgi:uncharacterized protein